MSAIRERYPLEASYRLDASQLAQFQRDGFIVLRGVLDSKEIAAYRGAIGNAARHAFEEQNHELTFEGAFHQGQNLRLRCDDVRQYCLSRRFGAIAAQLLSVDRVRLYHDQALFKPGNTGPSYWHQDQYFWPLDTRMSLGLWMPMVPISAAMGPIRYAAGSHGLGDLGQHTINKSSEAFFDGVIEREGLKVFESVDFEAGDCAFHTGWTIHGATANRSDTMREAMVVTFYPDGTRLTAFNNEFQRSDAEVFLGGRKPGDLADSALNPIVWDRSAEGV